MIRAERSFVGTFIQRMFYTYNLHDIVFVSPFLYVLAFLQGRILFNSLINNPNVRQEINRAVLYLQYMACMFLGKR
jgi:hypothetical protein